MTKGEKEIQKSIAVLRKRLAAIGQAIRILTE